MDMDHGSRHAANEDIVGHALDRWSRQQRHIHAAAEVERAAPDEMTGGDPHRNEHRYDDLPVELWLHILSFLESTDILQLRNVCRSWRQMAQHSLLWRVVNLGGNAFASLLQDRQLRSILHWCPPELEQISLHGCTGLSSSAIAKFVRNRPDTRRMDLAQCRVDAKVLSEIAAVCHNLIMLSVQQCRDLSESHLCRVVSANSQLEYIDAGMCRITNSLLQHLGARCPTLKHVYVAGATRVTDLGVTALARGCPMLRYLSLRSCRLSDYGCSVLAGSCRNLQRLDLRDCHNVSVVGLADIAARCASLKFLDIPSHIGLDSRIINTFHVHDFDGGWRLRADVDIEPHRTQFLSSIPIVADFELRHAACNGGFAGGMLVADDSDEDT